MLLGAHATNHSASVISDISPSVNKIICCHAAASPFAFNSSIAASSASEIAVPHHAVSLLTKFHNAVRSFVNHICDDIPLLQYTAHHILAGFDIVVHKNDIAAVCNSSIDHHILHDESNTIITFNNALHSSYSWHDNQLHHGAGIVGFPSVSVNHSHASHT